MALAGPDTKIIPGHGPLGTKAQMQATRDMLSTVRDRVAGLKSAGASEQEAVAKKPTANLDSLWAKGMFPGNEAVVIKPKSRIQIEISRMPRILYECGLRPTGRFAGEMKILGQHSDDGDWSSRCAWSAADTFEQFRADDVRSPSQARLPKSVRDQYDRRSISERVVTHKDTAARRHDVQETEQARRRLGRTGQLDLIVMLP